MEHLQMLESTYFDIIAMLLKVYQRRFMQISMLFWGQKPFMEYKF